jgi:hypothetical protein
MSSAPVQYKYVSDIDEHSNERLEKEIRWHDH